MDHGQHFTFCCLGRHSDLNSHFKNLNTSNTFLTLGEPHKPKHTLSTLSSKHDSMCHRKICIGQKIITQNPEFTSQGILRFQRVPSYHYGLFWTVSHIPMKNPDIWNFHSSLTTNSGNLIWYFRSPLYAIVSNMTHFLIPFGVREKKWLVLNYVSPVLMQNLNIWNFHSSLALNNGKLVWYCKSLWYAIVSNMTHFYILFGMREKMAFVELCVSPVLTQNEDIWNFYGSLTLNNGKLIWYFRSPWYAIVSNRLIFSFCLAWEKNCLFWTMDFTCTKARSKHLEFLHLIDFE